MIDKINDEFIVDCTNNSKEERQQVYKFLVDNRNYWKSYLEQDFPIIACNKKEGASHWETIANAKLYKSHKNHPIYTFEQFKKYVLKQETMEKEIIGYKLIKEYPNSKSLGYFEKYTTGKLSQYPEYWQPVYKEEVKVGDWVTCKEGFLESDS